MGFGLPVSGESSHTCPTIRIVPKRATVGPSTAQVDPERSKSRWQNSKISEACASQPNAERRGSSQADSPRAESSDTSDGLKWIIPGMVDVHCHIGLGKSGAVEGEDMLAQAHQDRDSGVLLARDCGIPGDNSWISGRPDALTILRAGRHIAKPKRYIRGYALEIEDSQLPETMAEQARRGDGWVKIVGDWIDRANGADSDLDPLWSTSALIEGVAAAHEEGARVTVHTFSRKAIEAC